MAASNSWTIPNTGWVSANGNLPQSFVFELPVEFEVSELSFNNVSRSEPEQASKDVEIRSRPRARPPASRSSPRRRSHKGRLDKECACGLRLGHGRSSCVSSRTTAIRATRSWATYKSSAIRGSARRRTPADELLTRSRCSSDQKSARPDSMPRGHLS